MKLLDHYDAMRATALPQLAQGAADLDPLLDSAHDDRRGITLLARPPEAITAAITALLADFRRLEPAQYYYPPGDVHLTILSLISCYPGFTLAAIEPRRYQEAVRTVLQEVGASAFRIRFAGLTASPSGLLVQGFPLDAGLQRLRDGLRIHFQASDLQQSIDQRYSIQTAHATVLRFRQPLTNPVRLVELIRQYQTHFIGEFEVTTLELVYNDWYQRHYHTTQLATFGLPVATA